MEIFCPNGHLVLSASQCDQCGWQRPLSGKIGQPVWGPVDILAGMGGESKERIASFAHLGDTLFIAPRSNELVAVSLIDGRVLWRNAVQVGRKVVAISQEAGKVMVVFQDTHSLVDGVLHGSIDLLNPENGRLETLWTAPSHDLTPPVFWHDRILVRTAESRLYALDRSNPENILWHFDLQTWWAAHPIIAGGTIALVDGNAMYNDGRLVGIDARDGTEVWKYAMDGFPPRPACSDETQIYVMNGKKMLVALDKDSGGEVWRSPISHIYSQLAVFDGHLYLACRGSSHVDAVDHYKIISIDTVTGDLEWQQPFPSHLWSAPLVCHGMLLTAGDDGVLRAFNTQSGAPLWEFALGHKEDPLQTQVYPFGDQVIVGTYFGQLAAVTIREPEEECLSPDCYIQQGEWQKAAESYALQVEYNKAGEIYANRLGLVDHAIRLYEKGKNYKAVGNLALQNQKLSIALENYRKASDPEGEANTLLAMGNKEGAARVFYENGYSTRAVEIYLEIGDNDNASKILHDLGDPLQAAQILEKDGKFKLAAIYFKEAGRLGDYIRLIVRTPIDLPEVEKLRASGDFETAARWQMSNQQYEGAAQDFRKAGKEREELDALQHLQEQMCESTEAWVWQRIAELSEGLGDYVSAAAAWYKLDRLENAGEAYLMLANSLASRVSPVIESLRQKDKIEIATCYEKAAQAFGLAGGFKEKEERCRYKARQYGQQPQVVIWQVESSSGFREMEWNMLTLTVQNIGFGRAVEVKFDIGEKRFEVDEHSRAFKFNLSMGKMVSQVLNLRPLKDQYGESVPLDIHWCWKDSKYNEFRESGSVPVKVVPQRDPQSSVPIIYQFQNVENLVTGGTQVKGDQVSHKGDSVTINKNASVGGKAGIQVQSDEGDRLQVNSNVQKEDAHPLSKPCPNCGRVISSEVGICPFCKKEIPD